MWYVHWEVGFDVYTIKILVSFWNFWNFSIKEEEEEDGWETYENLGLMIGFIKTWSGPLKQTFWRINVKFAIVSSKVYTFIFFRGKLIRTNFFFNSMWSKKVDFVDIIFCNMIWDEHVDQLFCLFLLIWNKIDCVTCACWHLANGPQSANDILHSCTLIFFQFENCVCASLNF